MMSAETEETREQTLTEIERLPIAARRFLPQIRTAAGKAAGKYSLPYWDAYDHAVERILVYAGDPYPGSGSDSGRLAEWEANANGNKSRLNKLIVKALMYDLADFSKKVRRQRRAQGNVRAMVPDYSPDLVPTGNPVYNPKMAVRESEYAGDLGGYPTLALKYDGRGLTLAEMAEELGVSVMTVRRRIDRELARYKADNAIAA